MNSLESSTETVQDDIYSFERKNSQSTGFQVTGTALPTARPMTSVRAAGYSSRGRPATGVKFDPMNPVSAEKQAAIPPEDQIKNMERRVNELIEESALLTSEGNLFAALEKAKDASKKERQLSKTREQIAPNSQMNLDLTYCTLFNLANQYHINKMYSEALNAYSVIVKNKVFSQSGRLRVNMGNIYFEQGDFPQAIKMYRMALDQLPSTNREFRFKIMRNIGIAFTKMGQFQDALSSFEAIVEASPDPTAGFNMLLCNYALGDADKMRRGFQRIVSFPPPSIEAHEENTSKDDPIEDHHVFNNDSLRELAIEKTKAQQRYILLGAKLIAPVIEPSFSQGFDWTVQVLKSSHHTDIPAELEIAKSTHYLKSRDFSQAIETLKLFEKKEPQLLGTAATNLSFLYYLEGDIKNAQRYAEKAIESDRYNAKAHTNLGNCCFATGLYDTAKIHYTEAVGLDATCVEALYNLGLVNKKLELYSEALGWFEKLHTILKSSPQVIFQIADIYERQGLTSAAIEWYNILVSVIPTDPSILAKLGDIYEKMGDKSQAFPHFLESYRYYPSNLQVISWLGAYYVDCEVYEQAIHFFERASLLDPKDSQWPLMIASCYRRSGQYQQAYETYRKVHMKWPENEKCLRFLVRICTELGLKEVNEYADKLAGLDKQEPVVEEKFSPRIVTKKEEVSFQEDVGVLLPD